MSAAFKSASLGARVGSAAVAVIGLILIGWKFREFGLQIMCGAAIFLMVREYLRLSLQVLGVPLPLVVWHWAVATALLAGLLKFDSGLLVAAICFSAYLTGGIWLTRNRMLNDRLLAALALGLVGLTLCVLFPYYEIQTLRLPDGLNWFGLHLVVVFGGDVFAYFGGISFGKVKFMPRISPKKTMAGSISGLAGSVVIGAGYAALALPGRPLWQVVLFSAACGFTAQMGDLLLSLIKRVANVKDSGTIMPGHGGVLDRLDGIIVTCPLIYAFAYLSETLL